MYLLLNKSPLLNIPFPMAVLLLLCIFVTGQTKRNFKFVKILIISFFDVIFLEFFMKVCALNIHLAPRF